MNEQSYEQELACARVRGAALRGLVSLESELLEKPLSALSEGEAVHIIEAGKAAGLPMYHFKRKELLPRVRSVLGFLKGVQPETLLDVGSGRGAFLFPFLGEFPATKVTSLDLLPHRVEQLQDMRSGGIQRLTALQQDLCTWDAAADSFDVVTLLEVLEHIPSVEQAVQNAVRLARRYIVVSVPSKPDDNPEHIHLLTQDRLTAMFTAADCAKLHFGGVPGHLILIAAKE